MFMSVENVISELQAYPTITAFLQHVQEIKTRLSQLKIVAAKSKDVLELATVHTAKGCEWQSVFLIGLTDGILPSSRLDADIEEEKRILYVGMTRAKQRLYLSYPRTTDNNVDYNKPCRFLAGLF